MAAWQLSASSNYDWENVNKWWFSIKWDQYIRGSVPIIKSFLNFKQTPYQIIARVPELIFAWIELKWTLQLTISLQRPPRQGYKPPLASCFPLRASSQLGILVGPSCSPLVLLPSSPPPTGKGRKAAQMSSLEGSGHIASFTSFLPTALETAPNIVTLISALVAGVRPLYSQRSCSLA